MWELNEIMSERHLAWYYSYSKVSIWAAVIIITQIKFVWFPATFKTNNNLISMIYDYALRLYLQFYLFAFFFCQKFSKFPWYQSVVVLYIWPLGLPRWLSGKEVFCNTGDTGDVDLIPGLGRSPREGNSNPLQYLSRDNPKNRGAWWATVHGVANCQTITE